MLPKQLVVQPELSPQVAQRAAELLEERQHSVYTWTDRIFARLLLVEWLAAFAAAMWISPRTWAGTWSQTHFHVWAAIGFGGAICSLPWLLAKFQPGSRLTRHVMAVAQMLMSSLLIHLCGGRIETHFHIFGSLAFLAFYRDWKVLLTAAGVVTADHFLRGLCWPESVFGVLHAGAWRWLEHAAWVIFEVAFLLVACRQNVREMFQDSCQRAMLENTNAHVENEVRRRTADLERGKLQLAQSEQRIRLAIEASPNGMLLLTPDGLISFANSRTEEMFGYDRKELLGKHVEMLLAKGFRASDQEDGLSLFDAARAGNTQTARASVGLSKGEADLPIEIGVNHFLTSEGTFVLASISDMTERRRAEIANRQLAAVVENSEDAIISKNLNGIILSWNKSAERIFGYSAEEVVGQSINLLIPEDKRHEETAILAKLKSGQALDHFESIRIHKNGQRIVLSLTSSPIRDMDGRVIGASKIARDITERKKTELRIQESLKELERKNKELDEFTYVSSHDLQEPIRKLVSFSKLLKQDLGADLNEQAERDLGFIVDAATRMRCLIQDLLALSRAGRAAMKHEPVSLTDCVRKATEALEMRMQETKAKIFCNDLPSITGDATLLTQLFQNLIGNAIKFQTNDRRPEIHISVEPKDAMWYLAVKDNGIGIQQEYLERIFAPFQRLHNRREYEGTGIGLSICRKSVERHGGEIWAESRLGEGTTFHFTLPISEEMQLCHSEQKMLTEELSFS